MKIVEANELVIRAIKENAHSSFKVDAVRQLGQTMLKVGVVTIRVKLDTNVSLKKGDNVSINPDTLEVVKI